MKRPGVRIPLPPPSFAAGSGKTFLELRGSEQGNEKPSVRLQLREAQHQPSAKHNPQVAAGDDPLTSTIPALVVGYQLSLWLLILSNRAFFELAIGSIPASKVGINEGSVCDRA